MFFHGADGNSKIPDRLMFAQACKMFDDMCGKNAVAKVKIPLEPKLPEIPSVGVPAEVKEALKAGKTKTESVVERTATDNTAKKVTVKKKTKA